MLFLIKKEEREQPSALDCADFYSIINYCSRHIMGMTPTGERHTSYRVEKVEDEDEVIHKRWKMSDSLPVVTRMKRPSALTLKWPVFFFRSLSIYFHLIHSFYRCNVCYTLIKFYHLSLILSLWFVVMGLLFYHQTKSFFCAEGLKTSFASPLFVSKKADWTIREVTPRREEDEKDADESQTRDSSRCSQAHSREWANRRQPRQTWAMLPRRQPPASSTDRSSVCGDQWTTWKLTDWDGCESSPTWLNQVYPGRQILVPHSV